MRHKHKKVILPPPSLESALKIDIPPSKPPPDLDKELENEEKEIKHRDVRHHKHIPDSFYVDLEDGIREILDQGVQNQETIPVPAEKKIATKNLVKLCSYYFNLISKL